MFTLNNTGTGYLDYLLLFLPVFVGGVWSWTHWSVHQLPSPRMGPYMLGCSSPPLSCSPALLLWDVFQKAKGIRNYT